MFRWLKSKLGLNSVKSSFKNKHVDYIRYVKDFYLENGLAYVSCRVNGFYDVIDPLSVEAYEWLNWDFTRFVESNAGYIPEEYPIVLEICGGKFSQKEKDSIVEAISDYYALKMGDAQLELDRIRKKMNFLLITGFLAFALLLMLLAWKSTPTLLLELVLIWFWFALWELGDLVFYDRSEVLAKKLKAAQLASMKIQFSKKFDDSPEGEAFVEEVIAGIIDSV